jgi:hypothetical protein
MLVPIILFYRHPLFFLLLAGWIAFLLFMMSRSRQMQMRDDGFIVSSMLTLKQNLRVTPYNAITHAELRLRSTNAGHLIVVRYVADDKPRKIVFLYKHYIPEREIRFLEARGVTVLRIRG